MISENVPWKDAAFVWWAITWRVLLYAIAPPYILTLFSSAIGDRAFWESMEKYFYLATLTYFVWGSIFAVKVAMRVVGLQFNRKFVES